MADNEDFASLFRQFEREQTGARKREPQVGDKVRGTVVSVGQDHVFVDLGAKSEGAMAVEELTDADGQLTVGVGDAIEAVVIRQDEQTGTLLLGGKAGRRFHGAEELEHAFQALGVRGCQPSDHSGQIEFSGSRRVGLDRNEGFGKGPQSKVRIGQRIRKGREALPGR